MRNRSRFSSEDRLDILLLLLIWAILLFIALPSFDDYYLLNDADWVLRGKRFWEDPTILLERSEDGFVRAPVVLIFALMYLISGKEVAGYRFLLFFFHAANVCLGYYFLKKLSFPLAARFAASFLFALHISHYQTRFWIGTLPHVTALTFGLFFLHAAHGWLSGKGRQHIFIAYLFLLAAIFSRDYAAMLPLSLPLLLPKSLPWAWLVFLPAPFLSLLLNPQVLFSGQGEIAKLSSDPLALGVSRFASLGSEWLQSTFLLSGVPGLESYQPLNPLLLGLATLALLMAAAGLSRSFRSVRLGLCGLMLAFPFVITFAADAGAFHRYRYYYLPSFFLASFLATALAPLGRSALILVLLVSCLHWHAHLGYRRIFAGYSETSRATSEQLLAEANQQRARLIYLLNPPASPSMVFASPVHLEGCLRLEQPGNWQVRFGLPASLPQKPFLLLVLRGGRWVPLPSEAIPY